MFTDLIYFFIYSVIHIILDVLYLFFTKDKSMQYVARVQNIETKEINIDLKYKWFPSFLAYLIITLGFWVFVIRDIVHGETRTSVIFGKTTLLALCIWGVYNLTNYVFFQNYNIRLVIRDILWGIISLNFIAAVTLLISK